ncbi:hypothetical protein DFQ28_009389 [Apophysomyces sp. BC1034]|nr:hypothetical protein DFQ30_009102 [Apophysomyces sp. BC1015]KAG0173085.1 hypothetical protein DFQ29_008112 [Apophysomyces sp. BC1021]KAG0185405.1 hypothetical protein DFQ28_009389 [Apophysomyces sp. BC1034]
MSTKHLTIQLLEPVTYIEPESDKSAVIRGVVDVPLLKSNVAVKNLLVELEGYMVRQWDKSAQCLYDGGDISLKTLIRRRLVLYTKLEGGSAPHLGSSRTYFELLLPHGLPESIHCSNIKVKYRITAKMEIATTTMWGRYTSSSWKYASTYIQLVRLPLDYTLAGDNLLYTIDSREQQSSWILYRIVSSNRRITLGSEIGIHFQLTPIMKSVRLVQLSVQLAEVRSVKHPDKLRTRRVFQKLAAVNGDIYPRELNDKWQGTIHYKIPDNDDLLHSTHHYPEFQVRHSMLISICFSYPLKCQSSSENIDTTVQFEADIDLLSRSAGIVDGRDFMELPTYDHLTHSMNKSVASSENHMLNLENLPEYNDLIL